MAPPPPPPPPVTPSPHRFIIKKQAPTRPIQQPTPLSNTQQQFHSTPRFNATPRFTNPTPSQRPVRHALPVSSPLISRVATPAHRPSRLQETIEDGFSGDEELDNDAQLSIEDDVDISESPLKHEVVEDDVDKMDFLGSAAKRRRLNSSPLSELDHDHSNQVGYSNQELEGDLDGFDILSSSMTEISSPSAPLPPPQPRNQVQSKPIPRFLPPSTPQAGFQATTGIPFTPLPSSTFLHHPPSTTTKPGNVQTVFSKPPRFRPPSPTSQSNAGSNEEPLPDLFSPRRRGGEKYIIGGLANELRSWIFNISNGPTPGSGIHGFVNNTSSTSTTVATTMGGQMTSHDQWKCKILIDEMSGGYGASGAGMTLIRGRQTHPQTQATHPEIIALSEGSDESTKTLSNNHTEVKLLLAGTGIVDGLNRAKKLGMGMQVGIRGPAWEIVISGEKWHVAVNWRVL